MHGLLFLGERRLTLRECPEPLLGPGEVLVKIGRAAVCGTDIHKYRAPAAQVETLADGAPLIVGHEPAGWIAALGAGVSGRDIGSRVMLAEVIGCGSCRLQYRLRTGRLWIGLEAARRQRDPCGSVLHLGCDAELVSAATEE